MEKQVYYSSFLETENLDVKFVSLQEWKNKQTVIKSQITKWTILKTLQWAKKMKTENHNLEQSVQT